MIGFAEAFHRIAAGDVDAAVVKASFEAIFAGEWTSVQIAGFAASLRVHGETAAFIGAAATALRDVMVAVEHGLPAVLDTCGTGGDGAHTLNVSTAAAVVAAACGVPVAKHGNRSVSSQCGSADVVDALGIPVDLDPARHGIILRDCGIVFLMAPAHHPALRHAAVARRELGIRTIFNALGPLVNPARATHQLVGVYDDSLRPIMAKALENLGVRGAWVVRSVDGLDEISPAAPTRVSILYRGVITERTILPEDFGADRIGLDALRGGDAKHNAGVIEVILRGEDHPARTAVALNAAAALVVFRDVDLKTGYAEALAALIGGRGFAKLEQWRRATS